jgi:cystathionine beta-lyase/cystathionine gamma-synthase
MEYRTLDTKLIHAGEPRPRIEGAVSMPIFCSANFESQNEANYHDLKYIRLNNTPNHLALHQKLAAIEGGEAALVFGSGMAAISTTLLTVLKSGSHLLAQNCLYGGTHSLLTEDFHDFGIEVSFVDLHDPESWAQAIRPESKGFYVESMTNPTVEVGRLDLVPDFCRQHGLTSMIDNTFASPVNFRPLEHGFDLSLHSATKYLNGHSDIVAGAVIGGQSWVDKITHRLNHLGGSLDPHACFLLQRGMKTLALRMERQNKNALILAQFLNGHPRVAKVNYPGLPDHPDHQIAKRLFSGFGGVLSFEIQGDTAEAERLLGNLKLPVSAPSLGGVETLVTRPCRSSHSGVPSAERLKLGITDGLIRVAVGIEDPQEVVDDFAQALGGSHLG